MPAISSQWFAIRRPPIRPKKDTDKYHQRGTSSSRLRIGSNFLRGGRAQGNLQYLQPCRLLGAACAANLQWFSRKRHIHCQCACCLAALERREGAAWQEFRYMRGQEFSCRSHTKGNGATVICVCLPMSAPCMYLRGHRAESTCTSSQSPQQPFQDPTTRSTPETVQRPMILNVSF